MSFETLKVEELEEGKIVRVTISRPKALNAMNLTFFKEIGQLFRNINQMVHVRVVIIQAEGKFFTVGLDLKDPSTLAILTPKGDDPARNAIALTHSIKQLQQSFIQVFNCRVPVLIGVHNLCIGGGVDLSCTSDIRYCTRDVEFSIKEIDIGVAADIGTLQLFPKIVGNQSLFKELAFTGRHLKAEQALQMGLVSKILDNKEQLDAALLETAQQIASKSPVAIYTIKQCFRKAESKDYFEGLDEIAKANGAMLQTKDMQEALLAFSMKKPPIFPQL